MFSKTAVALQGVSLGYLNGFVSNAYIYLFCVLNMDISNAPYRSA